MSESRSSEGSGDSAAEATLDRAIFAVRAQDIPPLPSDLFASASDAVEPSPVMASPKRRLGGWTLAVAAGTLAIAAAGVVLLLERAGTFAGREPDLVQVDVPSPAPRRDVSTPAPVEPHARLATLADKTATLKERVVALRLRAEATTARQNADRLLAMYARRD